jgi:putative acetyltransferase
MDNQQGHQSKEASRRPKKIGGRTKVLIYPERPEQYDQVYRVNELGFGRSNEAALVDALRAFDHISLVAEDGDEARIVGHILFTPVRIEKQGRPVRCRAFGLGPVAVLPERQRDGIGSELVRVGLLACRKKSCAVVVVVGDPNFYRRFGFVTANTKGLRFEHPVPDPNFMVLGLEPRALIGLEGVVRYHPEFAKV